MKPILLIFVLTIWLWSCSPDKCHDSHCGPYQSCNQGICNCINWYEDANCQTPMRQKWIGTFVGFTHAGASLAGLTDTFRFGTDTTRIDYDHCINKNFDLSIRNTREASLTWSRGTMVWDGIHMDSVYSGYSSSGVAIVSSDGKYATLTYTTTHAYYRFSSPLFDSIPSDSSILYTFTGMKQ